MVSHACANPNPPNLREAKTSFFYFSNFYIESAEKNSHVQNIAVVLRLVARDCLCADKCCNFQWTWVKVHLD